MGCASLKPKLPRPWKRPSLLRITEGKKKNKIKAIEGPLFQMHCNEVFGKVWRLYLQKKVEKRNPKVLTLVRATSPFVFFCRCYTRDGRPSRTQCQAHGWTDPSTGGQSKMIPLNYVYGFSLPLAYVLCSHFFFFYKNKKRKVIYTWFVIHLAREGTASIQIIFRAWIVSSQDEASHFSLYKIIRDRRRCT